MIIIIIIIVIITITVFVCVRSCLSGQRGPIGYQLPSVCMSAHLWHSYQSAHSERMLNSELDNDNFIRKNSSWWSSHAQCLMHRWIVCLSTSKYVLQIVLLHHQRGCSQVSTYHLLASEKSLPTRPQPNQPIIRF